MPTHSKTREIVANRIVLKSPKGKVRAWMEACDDYAYFHLEGKNSRITMNVDDSGQTTIGFIDKEGVTRLGLGLTDGPIGHGITLNDERGLPVCRIRVSEGAVPSIALIEWNSLNHGEEVWKVFVPPKEVAKKPNVRTTRKPRRKKG